MTKIKRWLYERYLPAYLKEDLLGKNDKLEKTLTKEIIKNKELQAEIRGMREAMESRTKIVIKNGGDK